MAKSRNEALVFEQDQHEFIRLAFLGEGLTIFPYLLWRHRYADLSAVPQNRLCLFAITLEQHKPFSQNRIPGEIPGLVPLLNFQHRGNNWFPLLLKTALDAFRYRTIGERSSKTRPMGFE